MIYKISTKYLTIYKVDASLFLKKAVSPMQGFMMVPSIWLASSHKQEGALSGTLFLFQYFRIFDLVRKNLIPFTFFSFIIFKYSMTKQIYGL